MTSTKPAPTDAQVVRKVRSRLAYQVKRWYDAEHRAWEDSRLDGYAIPWDMWLGESVEYDSALMHLDTARECKTIAELLSCGNQRVWELTTAVLGK